MMKTTRKLVLRRQTLRVLNHVDLARAIGGAASAEVPCMALADSGAKACTTQTPAVVTLTCG